jgi:hypothetical protein
MKRVDDIFIEKIAHKGTLTALYGINKTIEKRESLPLPTREAEV